MRSISFSACVGLGLLALLTFGSIIADKNAQPGTTQAGRSAAKAEYVPVKIGSETVKIKVPEDFVLAEGVEDTKWYKYTMQNLAESEQVPFFLFVPPEDLQKLKETPGYSPVIYFSVSTPMAYKDRVWDVELFRAFRAAVRRGIDNAVDEPGDAPELLTYIWEDDSAIAWVSMPDTSNPDLRVWRPVAGSYVLIGNRVVSPLFAGSYHSHADRIFLRNLLLHYLNR